MQWREEGLAPQVVFEVRSPGNPPAEMKRKRLFYERYGVEEYYECASDGFYSPLTTSNSAGVNT